MKGALLLLGGFRRDYMPELEEGSVLYMPTTLPGLPPREAGWYRFVFRGDGWRLAAEAPRRDQLGLVRD